MEIGRYRVTGVLGTGAMGEVVRARDEKLGRDVAIKRVKNILGIVAHTFHERFEAEARALAALAHPGVVQVFDLGREGDEPYLVMELVEGPTLKSVIADGGPMSHQDACVLGIQLARALEAAHARGILHRDIKPGNVLRSNTGLWKLADFGVAHVPDSDVTISGQFLGTPAYAAPEALTQGIFSPASDVFGLAATLYEAATGAKPHGDATMAELVKTALRPVIDPKAIPASLGVLGPILAAGLAVDPERRPTAAQMAELLAGSGSSEMRAIATATAAETVKPSLPARIPARTVPMPRWVYVIAGLAVLGLLLAIGDCIGGHGGGGKSSSPSAFDPSAGLRGDDGDDRHPEFTAPPIHDGREAKDWKKVADKLERGELGSALDKLYEFEERYGESPETAEIREWLERQPETRYEEDEGPRRKGPKRR